MGRETPPQLKEFLRRAARHVRLERAILFGSRARGEAREGSDYDLILVSEDFGGRAFYSRPAPLLLLWEHPEDLELLCYTPAEFEAKRRGLNIVATAVAEGFEVAA